LEIIDAANSDRVPIGFAISLHYTENKFKTEAFFLFVGTSPKDCALLGRNRNSLKLKMTAKLNSRQTLIAMAQDL
jgi:hypothetical protein